MTDKSKLDVLCLIDRNATMDVDETIALFNLYLETLKEAEEFETEISLVLFGENVEWLCRTMPIEYAKPLTGFTYTPMGNAALNDSLIKALNQFKDIKEKENTTDRETGVFILTNGAENWSKAYQQSELSRHIKMLENDEGWTFSYPLVDPTKKQKQVPDTKTLREVGGVLDIVCILDRSGSMSHLQADVLGGYNSFIEQMKKERRAKVTCVQFDTTYSVLYEDLPIEEVPKLTSDIYYARGCTALYDAIGQALGKKKVSDNEKVDRVILIVTDGYENASREVNHEQVQELIGQQEDHGAKVVYLASNISQQEIVQHTATAHSLNIGQYVGAVGTVPAPPAVNPQIYAQNYSCTVPNIQTFIEPAACYNPQVYASNAAASPTVMNGVFNAAFNTCASYPVSTPQPQN